MTSSLESALTPQELDVVSAAVASLHSTGRLGSCETTEAVGDSPPTVPLLSPLKVRIYSLIFNRELKLIPIRSFMRFPNIPFFLLSKVLPDCICHLLRTCPDRNKQANAFCLFQRCFDDVSQNKRDIVTYSPRPSRKSKEKFQRSLERKRQMGKNIEDYVSDDSEEDLPKQTQRVSNTKQLRRQGICMKQAEQPPCAGRTAASPLERIVTETFTPKGRAIDGIRRRQQKEQVNDFAQNYFILYYNDVIPQRKMYKKIRLFILGGFFYGSIMKFHIFMQRMKILQ